MNAQLKQKKNVKLRASNVMEDLKREEARKRVTNFKEHKIVLV